MENIFVTWWMLKHFYFPLMTVLNAIAILPLPNFYFVIIDIVFILWIFIKGIIVLHMNNLGGKKDIANKTGDITWHCDANVTS